MPMIKKNILAVKKSDTGSNLIESGIILLTLIKGRMTIEAITKRQKTKAKGGKSFNPILVIAAVALPASALKITAAKAFCLSPITKV